MLNLGMQSEIMCIGKIVSIWDGDRFFMDFSSGLFAFIAFACFLGTFVQRVSGIGYGIIVMLFFPLVLSMGEATALSGMGSLIASCVVAYTMRKHVNIKKAMMPMVPYCVIACLMMLFVKSAAPRLLMILLGVALCGMSVYFYFFSGRIHIRPTTRNAMIAGSIGGVLSGLFSMGGPPVMVYFLSCSDTNDEYLANIQFFFVVSNAISTVARLANGFVTQRVLWLMLPAAAAMVAANYTGGKVYKRISAEGLRKVVYGVVGLCGLLTILRATVLS